MLIKRNEIISKPFVITGRPTRYESYERKEFNIIMHNIFDHATYRIQWNNVNRKYKHG